MKIKMTSYMTGADFELSPGDVAEFDDEEAARIISVGGAIAHDGPEEAVKTEKPKGKKKP